MPPRTRKTTHLLSASEIKHHSPMKNGHFKHSKNFNEDEPVTSYNKIMSKIYLGNIEASKDKDFFKDKNIKAVLNCSKDIPNTFKNSDVEYMRIPVDDSLKVVDYNKMYHYLPAAVEFIYKHAVLQKQSILIHCYAGRQRSAICIAAFLVAYHNLTPYEACLYITKKRIEAFHFNLSLNFEQSLEEFYKDIKKCPKKIRQPKFKD